LKADDYILKTFFAFFHQVILLNKQGKYQLLALDLTAEVTGNCYVIGFQDKNEAAWFRDWLSKVPHHETHSPVVQPIGPTVSRFCSCGVLSD
jgi:hypothetical protein